MSINNVQMCNQVYLRNAVIMNCFRKCRPWRIVSELGAAGEQIVAAFAANVFASFKVILPFLSCVLSYWLA